MGQLCSKHQDKSVIYKTDRITFIAPSGFPGLTPGSSIIIRQSIPHQHSNSVHMNSQNIRFSNLTGWICSSWVDTEQFSLWKSDWKQIWSWYPKNTDDCQIPHRCRRRAEPVSTETAAETVNGLRISLLALQACAQLFIFELAAKNSHIEPENQQHLQ